MEDVLSRAYYLILNNLDLQGETSFQDLKILGFTDGNLSTKMRLLETKRWVKVKRAFVKKRPRTSYRLTQRGKFELDDFRKFVSETLIKKEKPE